MIPVWRRNYQRYRSYFSHIVSQYKDRGDMMSYLEVMLSLVTISIFALFALRPTLVTIAELIREIDTNTQTISTMDEKIQNITRAQTLYDRERSKIMLFLNAIPTGVSPETIIRQVEGLSAKHNVVVSSATLGKASIVGSTIQQTEDKAAQLVLPKSANNDVSYVDLTITVSTTLSDYPSLQGFLSDIESLRLPLAITQMTTSTVRNRENRELILVMKTYFPFTNSQVAPN